MITVAPFVKIESHTARGHGGLQTKWSVKVVVGDFSFYPTTHSGYSSPLDLTENEARTLASAVAEALQMEIQE